MTRLCRLFEFLLIFLIVQVDGVPIGAKSPILACHVPLELKIFADSSYQASSADLKSCTLITLSTVNLLFIPSNNATLASIMVSEKRSLQLLKQQTPEAAFSFSLRSTNTFPPTRHLKTIFNGTSSVTLLIEFLKVNKLKSFDIAWNLIQSAPDYAPTLKTLKAALAKEGINLTTTIGVEVDQTDAFHVSKIASIVDQIFLVPSYNRHYSGSRYPLVDKKVEQVFDSLELNEGTFLKLYSTLNLSWTKIVVGLSLQTLVWKLNTSSTIVGTQFNESQAVLQLKNYYESCINGNSTWRLRQQPNPFYKLIVAPTNDQWMIHVDPLTLGRRVDLLRQYGFGGVALYDYYQDDFAGVCNLNRKVYPLIYQAGLSIFNSSVTTPFPEISRNGGFCIPFLGLTSECNGVFNFGMPKLNFTTIGLTSSTTSSSVTAAKTTVLIENNPTTTTSTKYFAENGVTTPSNSSSSTVTTTSPILIDARMADAEYLVRNRRSSVSSEGTEPSFFYVNPPGLLATNRSEIALPAVESLVAVNAATEAFLTKDELWRDIQNQTHLSAVPETFPLNQYEDSKFTTVDQRNGTSTTLNIQHPSSVIEAVPTTSAPLKLETSLHIEDSVNPVTTSTVLFSIPPKLAVKNKTVAVKQTLPSSEIEPAVVFAIVPTITSFEAKISPAIQTETKPNDGTYSSTDRSTSTISSRSSFHEILTSKTTSFVSTVGDNENFTEKMTPAVTGNVSVSKAQQPSLIPGNNEITSAPEETKSSRPAAFGIQDHSSPYSVDYLDSIIKQTTPELPTSSSDIRPNWTQTPVPYSAALEILPTDTTIGLNSVLTSAQRQTNDAKAISSEITRNLLTASNVIPFKEQFTTIGISSVAAETSATTESIPPLTDLATTAQETMEFSTEHFSHTVSSMAFSDETQFSIPSAHVGGYADHFSTVEFSTFSEIPDKESITAGISTIIESSTKTEHFSASLASSTVNTIQPDETSEDDFDGKSSLSYFASPYYLKATDIPAIRDVSQHSYSSEQVPVSESSPLNAATSTEGSLSSNSFSPTFESTIPVNQSSHSTLFITDTIDSFTRKELHGFSSPHSLTSSQETDVSPSTPSSPMLLDASTEFTQLVGQENDSPTTIFSLEKSQSEMTSQPEYWSSIQQSAEETSPTESALPFYSTSFNLDTSPSSLTPDISIEYQESSISSRSSSNQQMEISTLPSAESSPEGSTLEHTFPANLVDNIVSTFIIPDNLESPTTSVNLAVSTEELQSQEINQSSPDLSVNAGISTVDSQLGSEIYPTTRTSMADLSIEESLSSVVPLVTYENDGDDNPLIDTLQPIGNGFESSREEGIFSSLEADFSTLSYVSREQTVSTLQSGSPVTTDSSVTSSFQSIGTLTGLHSASTSSRQFSEFEMGSGDEPNDVSTIAPIFENVEGSGEDSLATLEEAKNITPGFLNATDKPATSISEIYSTINSPSSLLTDSVSETSVGYDVISGFSFESSSVAAMTDNSFVQELEKDSPTKIATIFPVAVDSLMPDSSTEIHFTYPTSTTDNDIPSTKVSPHNTFFPTELHPSTSFPTFSVVSASSVSYSDYNEIINSTATWIDPASQSSFGSINTSTDSTSSFFNSTTNESTSNNGISTKEWSSFQSTSSMAATTSTLESTSTTASSQTAKFYEIQPTTTEIPLISLWSLLISKLNATNGLPFFGEYSSVSTSFWSNATSFGLNSEDIKVIPTSSTESPKENTENFLLETRPNTEAPSSFSTSPSPTKETNRTPIPVSANIIGTSTPSTPISNLFHTRPFWLQGIMKPIKLLTFPSIRNITTTMESSSTLPLSTKALHTSAFELRPPPTTETPPSTSLGAQQLSTSLNPNVNRGPCTENCMDEGSTNDSSIVLVAKDVANNVVVHLNVNAYMGDKKLNSSFNFEKWLEDLNRFLSSPSSPKPQREVMKPSPICEAAGNSILLKSLFCSNESLSTVEKILFPHLMNFTRHLAPAIIANLTTAMNLTEVEPFGNGMKLFSQLEFSNETSTQSTVSMSTERRTPPGVKQSTSFFDSQNVSSTLVASNLSDVPLPTVLNSLESFMLNLTELLKDAQISDLISSVNNLNHSIPLGFLENLIQASNSEDGRLFNQSAVENDTKDSAVATQVSTSTFSTPIEYDIFHKNFWKTNRRNPVRMLQRVAGPGLGIIPSIRVPTLRTTAKPISSIFRFVAKPAATRR